MSSQNGGGGSKMSSRRSSPHSRHDSPAAMSPFSHYQTQFAAAAYIEREEEKAIAQDKGVAEWARRTFSRSPSPDRHRRPRRPRSRSRPRALTPWKRKLEWLVDAGKLRRSDIDEETMQAIEDLDDELADTVLARFSEVNFSRVTNLSGFLMGIVRRVQQDGAEHDGRSLHDLSRPLRNRLIDLVNSGRLHQSEIDPRMTRALSSLSTDVAMEVLDKFSYANLDDIRSKTGFMLGIVKRLQGNDDYRYRRSDRRDRYR